MAELYSRYFSNEEKIITVDIDETGFLWPPLKIM